MNQDEIACGECGLTMEDALLLHEIKKAPGLSDEQAEPGADESALFEAAITKLSEQTTFEKLYEDTELNSFWALWKEARAAQSGQRAGVTEGWQLVPKEPNDDMIRHLVAELQGECVNIFKPEGWWEDIRSALRDAIAAAPTQQQENRSD